MEHTPEAVSGADLIVIRLLSNVLLCTVTCLNMLSHLKFVALTYDKSSHMKNSSSLRWIQHTIYLLYTFLAILFRILMCCPHLHVLVSSGRTNF